VIGEKDTQLINPEDYTFMLLVKYNKSLGYSFLIVSSVFSNFYFLYHLEWLDWGQNVLLCIEPPIKGHLS
jgi:hypothetical protein